MTSEKIIGYVSEQFGVDKDSLSRDTSFVDDLNADSLDVVELSMTIQNVEASFVAVQVGSGVNISARSLGAVNVQVIMESLGGGGHQTMAAAQLKHITPEAARARIQTAIDQYRESQKKPLSKNEPESRKKEKQG